MSNSKQRYSSIISPQVLAAATLLATVPGGAQADPAYRHLLDEPVDTAYVIDDGYLDFRDHVWLELDPLAVQVSIPQGSSNDLLEQLRNGFSLDPIMNSRVEAELRWFVRNPAYMERVFNRAQRYLPFIVEELKARELPLELALLPIVESAFDPFAYSHGRAAGLWQMIPGTARRFGVRQNWWYDGRRDVVDSTHAALDYLAYLYDLQDGDWPNAIASYNSGEGNVLKARKRNRANGKPEDFWNLRLSRETSAYVPRLFALVAIVRDPDEYGLTLPEIVNEPQFAVSEVGSQIDLALAAELAGIDLDTLSSYNAGVNRWATDPAGPHRLILPIDIAPDFEEAVAAVPENERIRWKRHKVKNGQAISQIADEYNVTVATIRSANNLRGNMIRAGSYLMIPVATKPLTDYSQSADARRDRKQNTVRSGNRIEHVVRARGRRR
jgi:membrane-bound lytic murein transglycosylase D